MDAPVLLRSVARARWDHVQKVKVFMTASKLALDDLTEYGGQDLRDTSRRKKARAVEMCWELMARLGVKHLDLE